MRLPFSWCECVVAVYCSWVCWDLLFEPASCMVSIMIGAMVVWAPGVVHSLDAAIYVCKGVKIHLLYFYIIPWDYASKLIPPFQACGFNLPCVPWINSSSIMQLASQCGPLGTYTQEISLTTLGSNTVIVHLEIGEVQTVIGTEVNVEPYDGNWWYFKALIGKA